MGEDEEGKLSLHGRVAAATTSATVGAAVGGPVGAITAAALTEILMDFGERWNEQRRAQVAEVWAAAESHLGVDPASQARAHAEQFLLGNTLNAAANAVDPAKLQALSHVLAEGLGGDEARLDSAAMQVAAIDDLEAPHIKVLARIAGFGNGDEQHKEGSQIDVSLLYRHFPGYRTAIPNILATLVRHGLVREVRATLRDLEWIERYGTPRSALPARVNITAFGIEILDLIRA